MHADISWPAKRLPFSQVRQRFLCTYRCHTIVQVHSVYPKTHRHLHTPTLRALNVVYFDFNFDFKHLKPYIYIYIYIYIFIFIYLFIARFNIQKFLRSAHKVQRLLPYTLYKLFGFYNRYGMFLLCGTS